MIVTERFVFIHMHKAGGQFLNEIIQRCVPDHRTIGYHFPRAEVPPGAENLPVVGMVRNPWDWYVSWYAFNKKPGANNPLFHVVSNGGSENFKATVTNLVNLGSDRPQSAAQRDELIRLLPESLDGNRGVGLTRGSMRNLSGSDKGYYSWLFDRMLGGEGDDRTFIGRFENLGPDFLDIMGRLSVREIESFRRELGQLERKNVSRHTHYSHFYDDELKTLVADKEAGLIRKFDYEFESLKASGASYEFPEDACSEEQQGFRKLLGRETNFLRLNESFDVRTIRERVAQFPAEKWLESERERLFDVHRDTQALLIVHFEDVKYRKPDYREIYYELQDALTPVIDYIANYYRNNGFIVRLILAKLLAGGKIPKHTDAGYSLLNCHRIHLPIVTNEDVVFHVGGEEINMRAGELWEINNGTVHAVENRGAEDRIHLIVDWMPNYACKPEEEVLAADQPEGNDNEAANAAMLGSLIRRAHQLHLSSRAAQAESLYRQVLHFDENHVAGNNLMGLLCLQTKRFDEAVQFIEKALSVAPDDAQAEANLGLALNALDRPQDAIEHFHKSLRLAPNNARVYNNLGNIYFAFRRVKDAITCYQHALSLQPGFAEVHFNLGSALMTMQRHSEAAASFRQCLALQPDFTESRRKLEQALQASRNE
ncbi:MAG: tetratricopeptide repeat protein [Woeseia sp.]